MHLLFLLNFCLLCELESSLVSTLGLVFKCDLCTDLHPWTPSVEGQWGGCKGHRCRLVTSVPSSRMRVVVTSRGGGSMRLMAMVVMMTRAWGVQNVKFYFRFCRKNCFDIF